MARLTPTHTAVVGSYRAVERGPGMRAGRRWGLLITGSAVAVASTTVLAVAHADEQPSPQVAVSTSSTATGPDLAVLSKEEKQQAWTVTDASNQTLRTEVLAKIDESITLLSEYPSAVALLNQAKTGVTTSPERAVVVTNAAKKPLAVHVYTVENGTVRVIGGGSFADEGVKGVISAAMRGLWSRAKTVDPRHPSVIVGIPWQSRNEYRAMGALITESNADAVVATFTSQPVPTQF